MLFKDAEKALSAIAGDRYWSIRYQNQKGGSPEPCYMYMDGPPTIFEELQLNVVFQRFVKHPVKVRLGLCLR